MLAIKLQRIGKKHRPSYRLVVAERRSKLGGPPVEDLGSYNGFSKASTIKKDRVQHWLKMGAQPTATVHNLLVKEKVVDAPKRAVKIKKPVAKTAEAESTAPVQAEAVTPTAAAEEISEAVAE